jgi:glucose-6-phosphate dehydrogenase assembly protein OpcA
MSMEQPPKTTYTFWPDETEAKIIADASVAELAEYVVTDAAMVSCLFT